VGAHEGKDRIVSRVRNAGAAAGEERRQEREPDHDVSLGFGPDRL
jgi:hypothetical protein